MITKIDENTFAIGAGTDVLGVPTLRVPADILSCLNNFENKVNIAILEDLTNKIIFV